MTLNGIMAVILRYFSEFAYFPGVLRKSSRSLSHLLVSSCTVYDGLDGSCGENEYENEEFQIMNIKLSFT